MVMTAMEEREYHAAHPDERRPNIFEKDTIKCKKSNEFNKWKSAYAQIEHMIDEKKRIAREEAMKNRKMKKSNTNEEREEEQTND